MRILYLNNLPAPYTVERFNAVSRLPDVELEAGFLMERTPDRSWTVDPTRWRFRARYLGTGARGVSRTVRLVRDARPDVVVSLYERPEFLCGIAAARASGAATVLHALKTFEAWAPRRRHRELAKRAVFPRVDFHVAGPDSHSYVLGYGARIDRIHTLAEPVDVEHFGTGSTAARRAGARVGTGVVFLYVGRLWERKGLDHLLDAFEELRREGIDASLVLAGDGVDEQRYRERAASLPRVSFLGFVGEDALPEVYGGADVFVFPTLGDPYGLVVEEAMAAGLPVISTTAAGDIRARVTDGATGLLVPPGDAQSLRDAMRRLALDPGLRERLGRAGAASVSPRTVEWWSREFVRMLEGVLTRNGVSR